MFPVTLLSVGLGGAIGAMLRYVVAISLSGVAATMVVNIFGSFLMGCAVVYLFSKGADTWQPFVMTGILGGAVYVIVSVVLSIAALVAGILIMRGVLA